MNGKLFAAFMILTAMIFAACSNEAPAETWLPNLTDTPVIPIV